MSFRMFLQEVEKGMPRPAYLFHSSDAFLLREALNAIRSLVPEDVRDFNFHVFDHSVSGEEPASFEEIVQVVNTVSFFGGRRFTVLISNIQKMLKKDIERLDAHLLDPPQESVLVLLHNGLLKKDKKEKFKMLKPVGLDVREQEIPLWIKQKAKSRGMDLSVETIEYLIGFVGTDFGILSSEVEKMSLLGKKMLQKEDISEILAGGKTYTIFDLVDALRKNDADKVFSICQVLRGTAEDYSLIGALNWQYGRLRQLDNEQTDPLHFSRVFELLSDVDKDMKSSGRTFPLEYLLVKLLRLQRERLPSS